MVWKQEAQNTDKRYFKQSHSEEILKLLISLNQNKKCKQDTYRSKFYKITGDFMLRPTIDNAAIFQVVFPSHLDWLWLS